MRGGKGLIYSHGRKEKTMNVASYKLELPPPNCGVFTAHMHFSIYFVFLNIFFYLISYFLVHCMPIIIPRNILCNYCIHLYMLCFLTSNKRITYSLLFIHF